MAAYGANPGVMTCAQCGGKVTRFARTADGWERYRCAGCRREFIEHPVKTLGQAPAQFQPPVPPADWQDDAT